MIQTIIPSATYQANILAALQQTGIANTTAGGKARAFCDIVGDQLGTHTRVFSTREKHIASRV